MASLVRSPFLRVPVLTIGLLMLSETKAFGESGLQGNYGGVPIDLGHVLRSDSLLTPRPEDLANAVIKSTLRTPGMTPEFNPENISLPSTGVQFQGRYDLPNSPLSVRGSVYVSDRAKAVMPAVTYDLPVANNTNIYAGAGLAIVDAGVNRTTPLGNRTGVVITTGVETAVSQGVVLYGDAKFVPGKEPKNAKLRYQLGVGYRF